MRKRSINRPVVVKYIPQRTCLACHKLETKQKLIRLVRLSDGTVEVDTNGKKNGRGAYLCPAKQCWETGLKGNRLEHLLRTSISQDNREHLAKFGRECFEEQVGG
ncbi:MAG: YlxR family protein [Chloroflexi bacterium]|nr:YlxR family protein [Chloroflexota bacterium]